MKNILFVLVLATNVVMAADKAPPPPCSDGAYRQFDFWLGMWTSYTKDGTRQGTNNDRKFVINRCKICPSSALYIRREVYVVYGTCLGPRGARSVRCDYSHVPMS